MSDSKTEDNKAAEKEADKEAPKKKTLGLKGGTLSLKGAGAAKPAAGGGTVVEVRRKRSAGRGAIQTPDHAAPTAPKAAPQSALTLINSGNLNQYKHRRVKKKSVTKNQLVIHEVVNVAVVVKSL